MGVGESVLLPSCGWEPHSEEDNSLMIMQLGTSSELEHERINSWSSNVDNLKPAEGPASTWLPDGCGKLAPCAHDAVPVDLYEAPKGYVADTLEGLIINDQPTGPCWLEEEPGNIVDGRPPKLIFRMGTPRSDNMFKPPVHTLGNMERELEARWRQNRAAKASESILHEQEGMHVPVCL